MAKSLQPKGSDGNFTGAVRLIPFKGQGVPNLRESMGRCGNCGTSNKASHRPGATYNDYTFVCRTCKVTVHCGYFAVWCQN